MLNFKIKLINVLANNFLRFIKWSNRRGYTDLETPVIIIDRKTIYDDYDLEVFKSTILVDAMEMEYIKDRGLFKEYLKNGIIKDLMKRLEKNIDYRWEMSSLNNIFPKYKVTARYKVLKSRNNNAQDFIIL